MLSRIVSGLLVGALVLSGLQCPRAAGEELAERVSVAPAPAVAEAPPAPGRGRVNLAVPLSTPSLILVGTGAKRNALDVHGWGAESQAVYQLWERRGNGKWRKAGGLFRAPNSKETRISRVFPASWRGSKVSYRVEKTVRRPGVARYSRVVSVTAGKPMWAGHATGSTSVTLRWHQLSGVKGYRIETRNSKGKWVKAAHVTKATTQSRKITSVAGKKIKPGMKLSFRIIACTKVSSKSCTPLKTVKSKGKKAAALKSEETFKVETVPDQTRAHAGQAITAMLGGTTAKGGLLYLKGTSLSTPIGKGRSHPYLKYLWDASKGVLELHLFVKFTVAGTAPRGSRSGSTMRSLYLQGAQEVWGGNMLTGSSVDFVRGSQFYTRVVFHDWANRAGERHASGQVYLNVQLGGRGLCSDYWYSECGSESFGFAPKLDGETWIFLPWDTEARVPGDPLTVKQHYPLYFRFSSPGLRISAAHETGHALGLGDSYGETSGKKWDRMMENPETTVTTSRGVRYAHLMKDDEVFIKGSGLERTVVTANDVEMALYSYANAYSSAVLSPSSLPAYLKIWQNYASFDDDLISCMIRDRTTDKVSDGSNRKGSACR